MNAIAKRQLSFFALIAGAVIFGVVLASSTNWTPFQFFCGCPHPGQGDDQQEHKEEAGGSGFIISEDGFILTNNPVVENGQKIEVKVSDQHTFKAKVIGTDPATDIALLKIDAKE